MKYPNIPDAVLMPTLFERWGEGVCRRWWSRILGCLACSSTRLSMCSVLSEEMEPPAGEKDSQGPLLMSFFCFRTWIVSSASDKAQ